MSIAPDDREATRDRCSSAIRQALTQHPWPASIAVEALLDIALNLWVECKIGSPDEFAFWLRKLADAIARGDIRTIDFEPSKH